MSENDLRGNFRKTYKGVTLNGQRVSKTSSGRRTATNNVIHWEYEYETNTRNSSGGLLRNTEGPASMKTIQQRINERLQRGSAVKDGVLMHPEGEPTYTPPTGAYGTGGQVWTPELQAQRDAENEERVNKRMEELGIPPLPPDWKG